MRSKAKLIAHLLPAIISGGEHFLSCELLVKIGFLPNDSDKSKS